MRRFLPTRYELVHKSGTLRKTATPATRRNSQFAGSISRLAEISTGKMQKNSSDPPTSRSHNIFVRTPIHANFISLESRLLKLSNGAPHDPFWAPEDSENLPKKSGQKTIRICESRRICWRCHVADKTATCHSLSSTLCDAASPWVRSLYKSNPPPPIPEAWLEFPLRFWVFFEQKLEMGSSF